MLSRWLDKYIEEVHQTKLAKYIKKYPEDTDTKISLDTSREFIKRLIGEEYSNDSF